MYIALIINVLHLPSRSRSIFMEPSSSSCTSMSLPCFDGYRIALSAKTRNGHLEAIVCVCVFFFRSNKFICHNNLTPLSILFPEAIECGKIYRCEHCFKQKKRSLPRFPTFNRIRLQESERD